MAAMLVSDFEFELPKELIAKYPCEERTGSRLLHVKPGQYQDCQFPDILQLLQPDDLLVFNNTKVIPARLLGHKATGGQVEILVERVLDNNEALAHVRASKSPKAGATLNICGQAVEVLGRQDDLFHLKFNQDVYEFLESYGQIPLPHYMDRAPEACDKTRYQTVYSEHPGAVAAPTAGLHFDDALLNRIKEAGVKTAYLTLHVGAGTFAPIRVDKIKDHKMHSEYACVSQEVVDLILQTKAKGKRVIAVGTTTVRTLETAAQSGTLKPFKGETDIFIYPGFTFNVIDVLITNFHLPGSTLMMLVSAFAGKDTIMQAYDHAIKQQYRFFSYGDAMFLHHNRNDHAI